MARKTGLGRGLEVLIPGIGEIGEKDGSVIQLPIDKLTANPGQPRKNFDEAELQELAASITEHGVIVPIIAADAKDGTFIIIAGERRTRAARMAGLDEIPAIVRDYTDQTRQEIALIENIQRIDLNPIEEAAAYKNLMDFSRLSQEELAARVGKRRSTVANALRLLKLPADMQQSLEKGTENGGISAGHARALLALNDKKTRERLFKEIIGKGLSVREAEKRSSALNDPGTAEEKPVLVQRPPEIVEMEEKFIERLGTKVTIEGGLEKGRIHIDYYSMDDLGRLYEIIGD